MNRESRGDRRACTRVRLTAPARFVLIQGMELIKFVRSGRRTAPLPSDKERGVIPSVDADKYGRKSPSPTIGIIETPPRGIPIVSRLSLTRRVTDPGLFLNPRAMAWRPYENLMEGVLDNRTAGKVTGWMRFFRRGMEPLKVDFDLEGDFHEDIRGAVIKLRNPQPTDRNIELDRKGTYMEGFCPEQRGSVGDITAGLPLGFWTEGFVRSLKERLEKRWQEQGIGGQELEKMRRDVDAEFVKYVRDKEAFYPYVSYPYIEWYSENGRVVLELDSAQVEILREEECRPKTTAELADAEKKRAQVFSDFLDGAAEMISRMKPPSDGFTDVTGMHEMR